MNFNPELEQRMNKLIESGTFKDVDDIIARALDSFELEQEFLNSNSVVLKEKLREGIQSELVDLDRDAFDRLHKLAESDKNAGD